ncbi:MAG: hypothetical protein NVS4B9_01740 [Ktedonobacteraceae bacterium]
MIATSQEYKENQLEIDDGLDEKEREARRLSVRENAKHVLLESGLSEMLQGINKNLLKGRGHFEEYDSLVLFRWGTPWTLRHLWIEIRGSSILFRLQPHRRCAHAAPLCDGEYHTLTIAMWSDRMFLQSELKKYYDRPVAEASSD